MTCGSNVPQMAPCGAANMPPIAPARPCTAPNPALDSANPPTSWPQPFPRGRRRSRHFHKQPATSARRESLSRTARRSSDWREADVRFNKLREGVQASAGDDGRRQAARQFRVNQRHARQHQGTAQTGFDAMLW